MSRELYKDDRYFENFIIDQNKRIAKFTDMLEKLEGNDAGKAQNSRSIANMYRDLMSAKYSIGASKNEVRRHFLKYADSLKCCGIANYAEMADVLSLAVLFDISADAMDFALENAAYDSDALVGALKEALRGNAVNAAENGNLLFPDEYGVFYEYMAGAVDTESFLKFMENEWYDTCREFSWFDSHKSSENVYSGYWSWLAGALLKLRGGKASDMKYIPCGLF